jgi:hypothetical protein
MTLADTAPNITRSNELINNGTANTVVNILKSKKQDEEPQYRLYVLLKINKATVN